MRYVPSSRLIYIAPQSSGKGFAKAFALGLFGITVLSVVSVFS